MPTILVLGPPCSGKSSIADYLVAQEGFERVYIKESRVRNKGKAPNNDNSLFFNSSADFLDYATLNWRKNYVTCDVRNRKDLSGFIKRPWVLLVGCEAAISWRWQRSNDLTSVLGLPSTSLPDFILRDDVEMYGDSSVAEPEAIKKMHKRSSTQTLHLPNGHTTATLNLPTVPPPSPEMNASASFTSSTLVTSKQIPNDPLAPILRMCNVHIQTSNFSSIENLHSYLKNLDLTREDRMRPGWDQYFMTLAGLASLRSNCMKRRVGAVLVSNKRVISTGYNGTPRGMRNCNEGGCPRCNSTAVTASSNGTLTPVKSGVGLDECLCLHAEENALLEAGRDRASAGEGGVMYCNTCPCLRCAVKIVQTGLKEIVYSQSYSMDELSARIFKEAGVTMRQIEISE